MSTVVVTEAPSVIIVYHYDEVLQELRAHVESGLVRIRRLDVTIKPCLEVPDATPLLSPPAGSAVLFSVLHASNNDARRFYKLCEARQIPVIVVSGGSVRPGYVGDVDLFVPRIAHCARNIPDWMERWYALGKSRFAREALAQSGPFLLEGAEPEHAQTRAQASILLSHLAWFDLTVQALLREAQRATPSFPAFLGGGESAAPVRQLLVQCARTEYPFTGNVDRLVETILRLGRQKLSTPSLPAVGTAANGSLRRAWDLVRAGYADPPSSDHSYAALPPDWQWKKDIQDWSQAPALAGRLTAFVELLESAHREYLVTAKKIEEYCKNR